MNVCQFERTVISVYFSANLRTEFRYEITDAKSVNGYARRKLHIGFGSSLSLSTSSRLAFSNFLKIGVRMNDCDLCRFISKAIKEQFLCTSIRNSKVNCVRLNAIASEFEN